MNRFRITPSVIPNLFTAMNMFSGFLSIVSASQGRFIYASWLIIIAGVFDALSDVVSFGAAPPFLIYKSYLFQFDAAGIIISSFLMLAGGFRLARFNIQLTGFDKEFFRGLPIPMSAMTIASFCLAFYLTPDGFSKPYTDIIIPLILVLSFLMISRIRYDSIPKFKLSVIKEKPSLLLFLLAAVLLLIFFRFTQALFFMFVFTIVFGIFRHIFYLTKKKF